MFVNYDNTQNPFNLVTEVITFCSNYVSQFEGTRVATAEEEILASEGADLMAKVARILGDIANTMGTTMTVMKSPSDDIGNLYKSTRARLPSQISMNTELASSLISPFGLGVTQDALQIAKEKGVKKCIAMMEAERLISGSAEEIVNVLFMYLDQFDPKDVGEYISGDGGTTEEGQKKIAEIRNRFFRKCDDCID